jgi:hypothetical protein
MILFSRTSHFEHDPVGMIQAYPLDGPAQHAHVTAVAIQSCGTKLERITPAQSQATVGVTFWTKTHQRDGLFEELEVRPQADPCAELQHFLFGA